MATATTPACDLAVAALAIGLVPANKTAPAGVVVRSRPLAPALTTGGVLAGTSVVPLGSGATAGRAAARRVAARAIAAAGGTARTRRLGRISKDRRERQRPRRRRDCAVEQRGRHASKERAPVDHHGEALSPGQCRRRTLGCRRRTLGCRGCHRSGFPWRDSHVITSSRPGSGPLPAPSLARVRARGLQGCSPSPATTGRPDDPLRPGRDQLVGRGLETAPRPDRPAG